MLAKLVYDGGDYVSIPTEMGVPRSDQMQGTPAEQLTELAGRTCYDSLGRGRPSFTVPHDDDVAHGNEIEGYHDHILKVGHGSVLEHFNFTIEIRLFADDPERLALVTIALGNRPGVFARQTMSHECPIIRITTNLRAIRDWDLWTDEFLVLPATRLTAIEIGNCLRGFGGLCAPHIIERPADESLFPRWCADIEASRPRSDGEAWISLYMVGSRGWSHEQVRHKFRTAVSQRSTRFVDESESPWIEHPLITQFSNDLLNDNLTKPKIRAAIEKDNPVIKQAQYQYTACVDVLEKWLIFRGVDKLSARKQARGAARGYLGNALQTEMIFSASVSQWKWMLRQRACAAADAEIRQISCQEQNGVLSELKRSRYGDCFAAFELQPSPDGIGQVAIERTESPAPV